MTNNNNKNKSKINFSTKNTILNKSSPSATSKSPTTTSKLTATPKLLNSVTPTLRHSSAFTTTLEELIATVNSQDEKIQASAVLGINTS